MENQIDEPSIADPIVASDTHLDNTSNENKIDESSIADPIVASDTHVDNTSNEKRIRKSVSRLSEVYDKTFEQRSERNLKPVVGDGVKLGDVLRIQNACHRNKITGELACNVHLLCYRTKGKAKTRLSSIKKFNGFGSNDDSEYRKRVALCDKMKLDDLKLLCDLLNVHPAASASKHKKDIAISIVDYLKSPFETGSEVFRMKSLKAKTKPVKSKVSTKPVKAKVVSKSDSDNDLDLSISESSTSKKSEPPNNLVDKENDIKKKSSSKRKQLTEPKDISKKKNSTKDSSSTKRSKSKALTTELPLQESSMQQLNTIATDETGDFTSPTGNLSDACFKEKITEILNGSDLNKITLNQVCDRVTEQFPDVDLLHRRQHIKLLVKEVIDQA